MIEKNEDIKNIEGVLRKGKYFKSGPDEKNNPMVKQYHYIKIELSNKVTAYAVIRELKSGEFVFYSIKQNTK